jgi:alpha-N-arabinofuranosidase
MAGRIRVLVGEKRLTPHLKAHATTVAGLHANLGGDERFYNNIFVQGGTAPYDPVQLPMFMAGNVYLSGALPSKHESNPLVQTEINPGIKLVEKQDGYWLQITPDPAWSQQPRPLVTTELLGRAKTPDLPYEQPDGSPYRLDTDYFGKPRNVANPGVGPFVYTGQGMLNLKVR